MKEQVKEIIDLFKYNQNYCALDVIEEIFQDLKVDDANDQNHIKEICEYAFKSKITKDFINYLKSIEFDFSIYWPNDGSLANLYVKSGGTDDLLFKSLEENGSDIFAVDKDGNNILHLLASEKIGSMSKELKQVDFAKKIINSQNIEDLMQENNNGETPLKTIIKTDINTQKEKNIELIVYLLNLMEESSIEIDDYSKFELVVEACNVADINLFKILLDRNVDQASKSNEGFSIAHYLVVNNNRFIRDVNALMKKKVEMLELVTEVNLTDDQGRTPLLYGMENVTPTSAPFWDVLITKGADVNITDNKGQSALLYAAKKNLPAVEALVEAKANIDHQNANGETALMLAILENKTDIALYLIKQGANVELVDNKERTALSIAADKGKADLVTALMEV